MRRATLLLAALLVAVSLAGCSKKANETETQSMATEQITQSTQKPTEKQTEKVTETSLDKTRELNGLVTKAETDTVEIQTASGKKLTFSTKGVNIQVTDGIKAGVQIKIMYKGYIDGTDTSKAKISSIAAAGAEDEKITEGEQQVKETADPQAKGGQVSGTIKEITGDRLVIYSNDGESLYFTVDNSKMTLANGTQAGNYVTVKYTGDVNGPDIVPAVSVVDSESGAAVTTPKTTEKTSSAEGTISAVSVSSLTISTSDGNELTFQLAGAPINLSKGLASGNSVKVDYTGELSGTDTSKVKVVSLSDSQSSGGTDSNATANDAGTNDGADAGNVDAGNGDAGNGDAGNVDAGVSNE